jgi:membrane-bound lytic murein transglycosylase B
MTNAIKALLQMTSVSLQPVPSLHQKFPDGIVPGDQKGLFKLAVQLRKFYISVIYNTATGYVLLVYLTNI